MEITPLEIKARIIRKLVQWRKWGGSHTENILKGLPSHLRGEKITKDSLRDLEREEWVLPAMKTGETHYSLNPKKADEILKFYERYCKRQD
ncbi:hypothetical protein HZB90_03740 [archaeon]|nr:hypothetical protein [archaeon]